MDVQPIDPRSRLPLYYQLQLWLRDRIEAGELAPGQPVPSEADLMAEVGLSRVTVRRAIAELEHEGLVVSRQGIGTFVADPARANAHCLVSFTSDAMRRGLEPGAKLLNLRVVSGLDPRARHLELAPDDELLYIKRLRTLNGEPVYLSEAYVPATVLPGITPDDFARSGPAQSLFWLIERHYRVPLADGEEVASAVLADGELRDIFALPGSSPVVKKTCLLRDRNGRPVVYEEATWGVPQRSRVIWRRATAEAMIPGGAR